MLNRTVSCQFAVGRACRATRRISIHAFAADADEGPPGLPASRRQRRYYWRSRHRTQRATRCRPPRRSEDSSLFRPTAHAATRSPGSVRVRCTSAFEMSTRNGAKHQNNSVDVGTLTAAPSHGGIHLKATWVRANAAPKPNVELSASRTAIGVSPRVGGLGSRWYP